MCFDDAKVWEAKSSQIIFFYMYVDVFACVFPCLCMQRGIEGDSQEKGYLLHGPGDLSVLTSSPSRLRCSRWRLPEQAEIDGEHGGHRGPAEFWTEPVGTNQPRCQQTAACLSFLLPLLSPFFLTFLYRSVALCGIFSLCHSACRFLHPCFPVSLSFYRPLLPPEDAVSAALADLDVMKLQVCQHRVCVWLWERGQ